MEELKALPPEDLKILTQEVRTFLIERIGHTGDHLASNPGVVELTITLFETLNLPKDRIIWDVGHQLYTHKVLSKRIAEFDELCQYGDLSGFPKRKEGLYDSFDTGHGPIPVSAGLGIALRRNVRGEDYHVVSVIGDGTLTGGMMYEALNNTTRMKKNFITVPNDNEMSTSGNVGGMSRYLDGLRIGSGYNDLRENVVDTLDWIPMADTVMVDKIKRTKNDIRQLFIPDILFENMGVTHLGLVDGHNIRAFCKMLREVQKLDHAVLVHVITKKGKGHRPTEKGPPYFHGIGPFDIRTGRSLLAQTSPSYTDVLSKELCRLGEGHLELVVVTVAMPNGTGLAAFGKRLPGQSLDVGVVEAHAVASATGMMATGLRPVAAVHLSSLQRVYDQILHDVCTQNLPALFTVDRTGSVGSSGETHQGISDCFSLTSIPNMNVMAPKNLWELRVMLNFATGHDSLLAIRYSGGETYRRLKESRQPISYGVGEMFYEKEDIVLLAVGSMVSTGEHVRQKLKAGGCRCSLANGRFMKPFDRKMVPRLVERHHLVATTEENVFQGGYGLAVVAFVYENYPEVKAFNTAIPDAYVKHGDVSMLREGLGIDNDSIIGTMKAGGYIGQRTLGIRPAPDGKEAWI